MPVWPAAAYSVVPEPWLPITWLIWYLAAAAYAMGPAFLSEAVSVPQGWELPVPRSLQFEQLRITAPHRHQLLM
jgi:hypothetical protein